MARAGVKTTVRGVAQPSRQTVASNKAASLARAKAGAQRAASSSGSSGAAKTTTTPAAPFLTATQQGAKDKDYGTYLQNLTTYNQAIGDNKTTEASNEAKQQYSAQVAKAQANALDAARGIMGSGIQAGDLADINTTLATNLLTLRTNLASTVTGIQKQIADAGGAWNTEVQDYNALAAENAQNAPPITTTAPATKPGAPGAATTPGQSVNAATKPQPFPNPVRPPLNSTPKMPTTPNAGNRSAALGAMKSPGQSKPATTPGQPKGLNRAGLMPRGSAGVVRGGW